MERDAANACEAAQQNDDEARDRAIKEFETVQMGFDGKLGPDAGRKASKNGSAEAYVKSRNEDEAGDGSLKSPERKKRKFEIDEDELSRIIRDERSRAKMVMSEEKVSSHDFLLQFPAAPSAELVTERSFEIEPSFLLGAVSNAEYGSERVKKHASKTPSALSSFRHQRSS